MTKHTPGPWALGWVSARCHKQHGNGSGHPGPSECVYTREVLESNRCVYSVPAMTEIVGWNENGEILSPEDARLIAAAPDMLEALRGIIKRLETEFPRWPDSAELAQARAAIAKAEGRE